MDVNHSLELAPETLSDLDLSRSHAVTINSIHAAAISRAHATPKYSPRFLVDDSAVPARKGSESPMPVDGERAAPLASGDLDRSSSRRIVSSAPFKSSSSLS